MHWPANPQKTAPSSALSMISAPDACGFYYAMLGTQPSILHPTVVGCADENDTSATLIDWMQHNERWEEADLSLWLHIHSNKKSEAVSSRHLSLFAKCPLRLRCPHDSGSVVPRSAVAVLRNVVTPSGVSVVYACERGSRVALQEALYEWREQRLVQTQARLLLAVEDISPPFTLSVIHDADMFAAVLFVRSARHTHVFHVRTGAAAHEGRAPPVASLRLDGTISHDHQRRHVLKGGCFTQDVLGVVSRDTHRHSSTFLLTSLQRTQTSRALLEMTTPLLHDADGALVAACGLAQRLVYMACTLAQSRVPPHASWSESIRVVLTVRVEGAVEGGTSPYTFPLSSDGVVNNSTRSLAWRVCGLQRYEGFLHLPQRRHGALGERQWVVEPLVRVSSRPFAATEDVKRSRRGVGERGIISCVVQSGQNSHRKGWLLYFGLDSVQRPDCLVEKADTITASSLLATENNDALLSGACRRLSMMWWVEVPAPLLSSKWVCATTYCSPIEWLLLCVVGAVLSLLLRLLARSGLVRRLRRRCAAGR